MLQGKIPMPEFTESEIVAAAARQEPGFRLAEDMATAGLRVLLEDYGQAATLNFLGRRLLSRQLVHALVTRFRLERRFEREAEPAAGPEESPLVILGLPRSGTTFLHGLLSRDPANRTPRTWELLRSDFPPDESPASAQDRIRSTRAFLTAYYQAVPALQTAMFVEADGPAECHWAMRNYFTSLIFTIDTHLPGYYAWLMRQDLVPAYRYYRRYLSLLPGTAAGGRLLLKNPYHLWQLEAMRQAFPGARFIHLIREPAGSLASYCSLVHMVRQSMNSRTCPEELGAELAAHYADGIRRSRQARSGLPAKAILDVDFRQLTRDPLGVAETIYVHFGLPLDAVAKSAMAAWLEANPKEKHGRHDYDLSWFGLNPGRMPPEFDGYRRDFGI